ncbi:hypothetical protein LINPERHAP2_LOCUS35499 [Linum perenne]
MVELIWLKSVLEVSVSNHWMLPQVCNFKGSRREIRLSRFSIRGEGFLNVAECCRNGRQFFINIPTEVNGAGWPSLLKVVSEVVCVCGPLPPGQGAPIKSFAEVVLGSEMTLEGKCTISSESSIDVGALGVVERLRYLDHCLCFRFMNRKPEVVNWKIFRAWMAKNWGLPLSAKIMCLGDDLWLLECPTKETVDRVVALNRCLYGSSRLFLDRWTPRAGRSVVLPKQSLMWIVIQGIPLHLRSVNLFCALGDFDDKLCPLNAVRIKIAVVKVIPNALNLVFKKRSFRSGFTENHLRF